MKLILSIFPGIDLLGRGFEAEGFCVVRGPDKILGQDIHHFHVPPRKFAGIIGGSPCQDFSAARRSAPTGYGVEMLQEFLRVVGEAQPDWFLLENVARVPDVKIAGYFVQRFDLNANECGSRQSRLRHFQFGSRSGLVVTPQRTSRRVQSQKICLATEGKRKDRRSWADFCELQGLPRDFQLSEFTLAAKYRAVGNGVPIQMARVVAQAIRAARPVSHTERLCVCGCGRLVSGKKKAALPACRKRIERAKRDARQVVTARTLTASTQSQKNGAQS